MSRMTFSEFMNRVDPGRRGSVPDSVGEMKILNWMRHLREGMRLDIEIRGKRYKNISVNEAYEKLMRAQGHEVRFVD